MLTENKKKQENIKKNIRKHCKKNEEIRKPRQKRQKHKMHYYEKSHF